MKEISTVPEDSIPSVPPDTVATSLFQSRICFTPSKGELIINYPELSEYIAAKEANTTQEELEKTLFFLVRDLNKLPSPGNISLKPLVTVHPLVAVSRSDYQLHESIALVEREMRRIIIREPVIAQRYLWMVKAAEFFNDLALFWRLIDGSDYTHRTNLKGTIVRLIQLADVPRLTSLCILPEVLYVAAAPEAVTISSEGKILCTVVSGLFTRCMELVVEMLRDITPAPGHSLSVSKHSRGPRISPSVLQSTQVLTAAAKLRIHSLSLPPWWRCACTQSPQERVILSLKTNLAEFCEKYAKLEQTLAGQGEKR